MEGIITRCINISLLDHKLKGLLSLFGIYSRLKLVDTACPSHLYQWWGSL